MSTHLTFDSATAAAQVALASALRLGKPVAITIVDTGGNIVLQHRHDGVHAAATKVSAAKARAAALFNRPSADIEALVSTAGRPALLGLPSMLGEVLAVQGGLPIHKANQDRSQQSLLGAIGISGGSPDEDEAIAQAAVDSLGRGHRQEGQAGQFANPA
ncbi:GlcG/HbpS family heme-binding protein [Rhodococcus sp. 114MFTsu3.1]|uniref:GlcG/HbpS family heme-binding protein n=1 Tax=Rhodococcus sp. 114MFTsu3.1 TaxID=1172184 RepID=UPI00037E2FEA|nr:heme-binding protein [Rhodococcus sp. 114MFTsu3.1]